MATDDASASMSESQPSTMCPAVQSYTAKTHLHMLGCMHTHLNTHRHTHTHTHAPAISRPMTRFPASPVLCAVLRPAVPAPCVPVAPLVDAAGGVSCSALPCMAAPDALLFSTCTAQDTALHSFRLPNTELCSQPTSNTRVSVPQTSTSRGRYSP